MATIIQELPTTGFSKKRKRGAITSEKIKDPQKSTKKQRAASEDDEELDPEMGINKSFSHMDSQLLSDYMAQRTQKFENDLSSVELEDRYIPGKCFMLLLLVNHSELIEYISCGHTRHHYLE
jgi:protein CMS1